MSGERQVKVLYEESVIAGRTEGLAKEIASAKPKDLLVVAILKGSFMFAADLLRALHRAGLEPQVEFFHLASYFDSTRVQRHGKNLARYQVGRARSRCPSGRRHSQNGQNSGFRQRPADGARPPARACLHHAGKAG